MAGVKVRGGVPPYQFWIGLGTLVTLGLGLTGWTQLRPDLAFDERLYRTLILFGMSYGGPEVGSPLALNLARFTALLVVFGAVFGLLARLFALSSVAWRARRATGHVVVLGDAPEVAGLASGYRTGGKVVVVGGLPPQDQAELGRQGVLVVDAATDDGLGKILRGRPRWSWPRRPTRTRPGSRAESRP